MTETGRTPSDDPPSLPPALGARRLLLSFGLAVVGLVGIVAGVGWWFHEPLMATGQWFVTTLGGPGIAIGFAIPDAFSVPIPNDAFLALGRVGHMPTISLVSWAMLGSLSGGSVGWMLGRWARRTHRLHRFLSGRGATLDLALRRYGVWVVAIAAITPLPYSVSAWAAGSTGMPYGRFMAVSGFRLIRIIGALALIDLGLMSIT